MTRDLANRMFRGSIKSMLLNLVQAEPITPHELDEIRAAMRDLEART
jgi:predicted transcriptional regulator